MAGAQADSDLDNNSASQTTQVVAPAPAATLSFAASSVSTKENSGTATLTVLRSGNSSGAVLATYATHDGSATAPGDYTATRGIISFAAGETSKTFTVPITDDLIREPREALIVNLSSPSSGAELGERTQARSPSRMTMPCCAC